MLSIRWRTRGWHSVEAPGVLVLPTALVSLSPVLHSAGEALIFPKLLLSGLRWTVDRWRLRRSTPRGIDWKYGYARCSMVDAVLSMFEIGA